MIGLAKPLETPLNQAMFLLLSQISRVWPYVSDI